MPITFPEIVEHIESIGWKYKANAEKGNIQLSFGTQNYVNSDSKKSVWMNVGLECEGQYIELCLPGIYNLTNCKYKGAALAALANIAYATRSLQCEYDPEDGEVRFSVDMWVLDSTVTQAQLEMMVRIAYELLEEYDSVIRHAMEHGKVDLSLAKPKNANEDKEEPAPLPPEIAELVKKAGSIEALRAALERSQNNT